jgi:hypothetical protein
MAVELLVVAGIVAFGFRSAGAIRRAVASLAEPALVRAYAIVILPWVIFSMRASVAFGGNAGNTEVALLPALPLLLLGLESAYGVKAMAISSLVLAPACLAFLAFVASSNIRDIPAYYAARATAIRELAPFAGTDVAIADDSYIVARAAGLNVRTSLNTAMHIENGAFKGAGLPPLDARLKRREFSMVLCMPTCANIAWRRVTFVPHYVAATGFKSSLLHNAVLLPSPVSP